MPTKKKTSRRWLDEHINDPYAMQAQKDGYRSRASYKLLELNEKDKLIRPGMLDLGSAPDGNFVAKVFQGEGVSGVVPDRLRRSGTTGQATRSDQRAPAAIVSPSTKSTGELQAAKLP